MGTLTESCGLKVGGSILPEQNQVFLPKKVTVSAGLAGTGDSSTLSLAVPTTPRVATCFPCALLVLPEWNEFLLMHLPMCCELPEAGWVSRLLMIPPI